MENKLRVLAIVGPTAAGKSKLAVMLAKKFNGVVISADSRQVYRGMDIGTTKITKEEMEGVPHYMLSIVEPNAEFNVSLYQKSVKNLLDRIAIKNKKLQTPILPILVGGTGMYVDAVLEGWQLPAVAPNPKLRAKLEQESLESLVKQVKKIDPNTQIDWKNKRRLIRFLEIQAAGVPRIRRTASAYDGLKIGIYKDKAWLEKRIIKRVREIDLEALVKEARKLVKKGYSFKNSALSAIGYDLVRDYIQCKLTKAELLDQLTHLHLAYAKRQLTWFRRDKNTRWLTDSRVAEKAVREWLRS